MARLVWEAFVRVACAHPMAVEAQGAWAVRATRVEEAALELKEEAEASLQHLQAVEVVTLPTMKADAAVASDRRPQAVQSALDFWGCS